MSCIFNLLLILGIGGSISTLKFSPEFSTNLVFLLISTILIWIFTFVGKKNNITRLKGTILILMFGKYITKLFVM